MGTNERLIQQAVREAEKSFAGQPRGSGYAIPVQQPDGSVQNIPTEVFQAIQLANISTTLQALVAHLVGAVPDTENEANTTDELTLEVAR